MEDYRELSPCGNYRLEIWETNKAPQLGYVKWSVSRLIDGDFWYVVKQSRGYTTLDEALIDGGAALEWAQQHAVA